MATLDPAPVPGARHRVNLGPAPSAPVSADIVTGQEITAYDQALAAAPDERAMQQFLEAVPRLLVQHLNASERYWVIPQKQLGAEYVTDFLIAESGSARLVWYAVELERPQAKLFTAKGDPSAALTHALRQIDDWRDWLSRNRDYASRPREQSGLGLPDIDPELDGLVIMGRDAQLDPRTDALRIRLQRQHRVRIETYDWLTNQAKSRLDVLERHHAVASNGQQLAPQVVPEPTNTPCSGKFSLEAVEQVFGDIDDGDFFISEARSAEAEVVILEYGDGDGDQAEIPINIVDAYRPSQTLTPYAWEEWTFHVEQGLYKNLSLLVSELAPHEKLQKSLIQHCPGVWFEPQWFRFPRDEKPTFCKVNVLVYLPPSSEEGDRIARLIAARQILLNHLTGPDYEPDEEYVMVHEEDL